MADRDEVGDVLAGFPIGTGYYGTQVGTDEATGMADLVLSSDWLAQHDREVAAKALRDMASRMRAEWFPNACPWVGALDDEADRIERGEDA